MEGRPTARTWEGARRSGAVDEPPEELVRALRNGTCAAMVGAGLSYPAGLPGFESLLQAVAESEGLELAVPSGGSYDDLDRLQFRLAERLGRERMVEAMRSVLHVREPLPGAMEVVLRAFCRLPLSAVVSWNWDSILDAHYHLVRNDASGFRSAVSCRASPDHYETASTPLLKMQGHLSEPATVVLTEADYERRAPEADVFLEELHRTRTVLYIGMSLRSGGYGGERRAGSLHYAILNDVTPRRRQELLEQYNIHAISYDSAATMWKGNQIIMEELARRVYRSAA